MLDGQISFWEYGTTPLKFDKPIRLIELFAGIGAQAKALENLGVDFEHYRICEFNAHAVKSYNAVHGTNFEPSDITKISGADLGVNETDKYCYILTYSFPCQDLSMAGKRRGMGRDSGTRSSLLWEVERLLDECEEKPQILLMENVPEVCRDKNKEYFQEWCEILERMGYTSEYALLNATDYGIPQNRNRCFMVSWQGKHAYRFPNPSPLGVTAQKMLEARPERKYYMHPSVVKDLVRSQFVKVERERERENDTQDNPSARATVDLDTRMGHGHRSAERCLIFRLG